MSLPLRGRFPTHTTAKFAGTTNNDLLKLSQQLVKEYWAKVGLPGTPVVPKKGALPFDLATTQDKPKGELRLRLVGVAPGDLLYFEGALFIAGREVAWRTTLMNYTLYAGDGAPPKKWIPPSAREQMERLESRPISLGAPPRNPKPHVAVAVGTVADLRPPAALKAHAARPAYVTSEAVDDALAIEKRLPEPPFPSKDRERIDAAVEAYLDANLTELSDLVGVRTIDGEPESVAFGFHAGASLEEFVRFVTERGYRVVALPKGA